jgi:hypothetical protein
VVGRECAGLVAGSADDVARSQPAGRPIAGKDELAVVGGPATRQAVRLRILFRNGPPIDLVPLDAGPNSRSGSTPCSTYNRQRQPGCPNAWSPTTRRTTQSLSAMPRLVRATSVIAPKAPPATMTPAHSHPSRYCGLDTHKRLDRPILATRPSGGVKRPRRAVRFARLLHRLAAFLGGPLVRAACGGNLSLPW